MECNKASKLHKLAADFVQISTESEAFLIDGLKDFFSGVCFISFYKQ
jgi:hypothetical protein